jgi:NADH dehydrogenase
MRVAIFGGTGFVGSYIVDALAEAGLSPVLLVREGSDRRVSLADSCERVQGDVRDTDAVSSTLENCDAAIFNIGILREFPSQGVTFEALQLEAARRVIDAAKRHGVKRFLLMSANGVEAQSTRYQRTKRNAEQHLEASGLDWTIIRPSVVFGDPRGRMEFATQLKQDIIDSPLPAPLFFSGLNPSRAGAFELSPVHVRDVATAFAAALLWTPTVHQTLHLGGPETLSWREILTTIAQATGREKKMLPVPALGVSTAAALFDRWERFPITREQIQMLMQGNRCGPDDLARLGIDPLPFDTTNLAYLSANPQDNSPWQQNAA